MSTFLVRAASSRVRASVATACTLTALSVSIGLGCGAHATSAASLTPAAATHPRAAHPVATEPAERSDAASDGVLVVSREIVTACAQLQVVKRSVDQIDPDAVWLVVLEGLADCMNAGDLQARRVRVVGDDEGQGLVKRVLVARGVAPSRLMFVHRVTVDGRVDITLMPTDDDGGATL